MADLKLDEEYPHSLTINIPFPTHRLANAALRSLAVDEELSLLVRRSFALISPPVNPDNDSQLEASVSKLNISDSNEHKTTLEVKYKATTPRMLRVAVNGFFESLGVIVQVMEELDVDVLHERGIEGLEGVQGVEQGLTGVGVGVGG
ncbi:hypothetical protein LTR37_006769 [Vermiconidia calcicola]|uniref:Uncharacterized protein n=1 Tax=Vermiconidia calcicola TaxID=1690605 RepID=A0ACC3NFH0_9PEZI|nr:hypothetical protein LTR37_006769 [Vermiconidia calcicola]